MNNRMSLRVFHSRTTPREVYQVYGILKSGELHWLNGNIKDFSVAYTILLDAARTEEYTSIKIVKQSQTIELETDEEGHVF